MNINLMENTPLTHLYPHSTHLPTNVHIKYTLFIYAHCGGERGNEMECMWQKKLPDLSYSVSLLVRICNACVHYLTFQRIISINFELN